MNKERGVIIKNVRLSDNADTPIVDDENGVEGKVNKTSDDASFVVLELEDNTNPFKMCRRTINYRDSDGKWTGATPKELKAMQGYVIPGARAVQHTVATYEIPGKEGKVNTVSTFSTIVLPHESEVTVFANAGHPIMDDEGNLLQAGDPLMNVGPATSQGEAATQ